VRTPRSVGFDTAQLGMGENRNNPACSLASAGVPGKDEALSSTVNADLGSSPQLGAASAIKQASAGDENDRILDSV